VRVHFTKVGWDEFLAWQRDAASFSKIVALIEEIRRTPFSGTGKPEPLKGPLSGFWSRRINQQDRLVYSVSGKDSDQSVTISGCQGHY
jgi:toxin YoeB